MSLATHTCVNVFILKKSTPNCRNGTCAQELVWRRHENASNVVVEGAGHLIAQEVPEVLGEFLFFLSISILRYSLMFEQLNRKGDLFFLGAKIWFTSGEESFVGGSKPNPPIEDQKDLLEILILGCCLEI